MQVDKEEQKLVSRAIDEWVSDGIITNEQADAARNSIVTKNSERQQLAQYFYIIAISSALLAFGTLLIDEKLLEHLRRKLLLSNLAITIGAGTLAAFCFWYANRKRSSLSSVGYETYQIPGTLSTLISLVYFCKDVGNGASYTFLTGIATLVFFILSISFKSRVLWITCVLAFMGWFGAFSTVHSANNLFLGMNYPVRFTVFGIVIILLYHVLKDIPRLANMRMLTYHAGLVIFFTGLWGVSVFGNFGSLDAWQVVRQAHILPYTIITGIITAGALYVGIHRSDETLRDYSILFLLLNMYTRYFEYFWNSLNKGLFFLVLAISFGLLAKWMNRTRNAKP